MAEAADDTEKCLSTKEIKALARPEFEANPDKFYPTETLRRLDFARHQCGECKHFYWAHKESTKTNCGDSQCEKKYSFIGKARGIGKKEKLTYAGAWKTFEESMTNAKVPCTAIKRYPVVARWRNDVDFVAAGIFCFQPYCVTGELDPPANPLICPQFCMRFNDLDNIGITGRHYSGFIMMGIQVRPSLCCYVLFFFFFLIVVLFHLYTRFRRTLSRSPRSPFIHQRSASLRCALTCRCSTSRARRSSGATSVSSSTTTG
jgi:alanyl-tRNA synthetase